MDTTDDYQLALIGAQTEAEVEEIAERALARASGADRATFVRPSNGEVATEPSASDHSQVSHHQRTTIDGVVDAAYSTNERKLIDDLTDTRSAAGSSAAGSREYRSLLCEPVEQWGVLVAADTAPAAFEDDSQAAVQRLASCVDRALGRIQSTGNAAETGDDVSTVVAHDLRNPLQVATARLEMVRRDCTHEQFPTIAQSLDRMQTLIDDLLVASSEDRLSPELEVVTLPAAVESSWQNVPTPEATLENRAEGNIRADPVQLHRLLENLIGNAVEHAGESVTITVGNLTDGFYLEDDGPGIAAENREQVFDAGFSTDQGGSGLGLAITERIADSHGWDIAVTDGSSGGARFEIRGTGVDRSDPDAPRLLE